MNKARKDQQLDPFAAQKKKPVEGHESIDENDELIKGKELELGQEIED